MTKLEGFLYVIKSQKDGSFYYGSTNNVNRRLMEHNGGRMISTRHKRPWELYFVLRFDPVSHARKIEQILKAQKKQFQFSWFLKLLSQEVENISAPRRAGRS